MEGIIQHVNPGEYLFFHSAHRKSRYGRVSGYIYEILLLAIIFTKRQPLNKMLNTKADVLHQVKNRISVDSLHCSCHSDKS